MCIPLYFLSNVNVNEQRIYMQQFFYNFPLYLQSVPVHSANAVKSCTKAFRKVLTSTLLYLIGSESFCDLGSVTYKLNLKNNNYNYSIYILNLVGRSIGKLFCKETIHNHENENVCNIGQDETPHRKHKRLKLGGGHILYDHSSVYTTAVV
jgi:hypothetical protein